MVASRRVPWRTIMAVALFAVPAAFGQYTQDECMRSALAKHNELRAKHGAPDLEWDESLVAREMVWTVGLSKAGCPLWHSPGGAESLFSSPEEKTDCGAAVQTWYDEEVAKYTFSNTPTQNKLADVGHFTQAIWRAATKIGCYKAVGPNGCVVIGCAYDASNQWDDAVLKANVLPAGTPVTPLPEAPKEDFNAIACAWYGCRGSELSTGLPVKRMCPTSCGAEVQKNRQAWLDEASKLAAELAANPPPAPQAADPTKIHIPVGPGQSYNREGYPYDYYDVASLQSAIAACEKVNGVGNCFRWDMTKVIPKCPPGYKEDRCGCLWNPEISSSSPTSTAASSSRKLKMM